MPGYRDFWRSRYAACGCVYMVRHGQSLGWTGRKRQVWVDAVLVMTVYWPNAETDSLLHSINYSRPGSAFCNTGKRANSRSAILGNDQTR